MIPSLVMIRWRAAANHWLVLGDLPEFTFLCYPGRRNRATLTAGP